MNFYMVQFLLGQHTRPRQKLVQPTGQIHCFLPHWLFYFNCLVEELTFLLQCLIGQREIFPKLEMRAWYQCSLVPREQSLHTQKTQCDHQPVTINCTRRAERYLRTKHQSIPTSM